MSLLNGGFLLQPCLALSGCYKIRRRSTEASSFFSRAAVAHTTDSSMKAVLRSDVLILVILIVHKGSSCSDPPCANSSMQDRVNFLTHANFTTEKPRVRKLATFAQTMANIMKDTNAQRIHRVLSETGPQISESNQSKDAKDIDVSTFPIPNPISSTQKVLKAAEPVLLSLLGTQALSTKGVLATTLLARVLKKYLENRSGFPDINRRISRRSGRSYLDSEAIVLFILGLGIGSIMGLGSVLLPLGFYGGYGGYGGYGAIPVNTQVTGRKRREVDRVSDLKLRAIGQTLIEALERYADSE